MITVTKDFVQQSVRKDPIMRRQNSEVEVNFKLSPKNTTTTSTTSTKQIRKPKKRDIYRQKSNSKKFNEPTTPEYISDTISDSDHESDQNNNNNNNNNVNNNGNNITHKRISAKMKKNSNKYNNKPLPSKNDNNHKRGSSNNYGKGKNFKTKLSKKQQMRTSRIIQQSNQKNINTQANVAKIDENFAKIKIVPKPKTPKKSGLAMLIEKHKKSIPDQDTSEDDNIDLSHYGNNTIHVYFDEYLDNPITLNYSDTMLIKELIEISIKLFTKQYNNKLKLKGINYKYYQCKFVDIDDDDDEVEIDQDMGIISLTKNLKSLKLINIAICLKKEYYNNDSSTNDEKMDDYINNNNNNNNVKNGKNSRRATLDNIVAKKNLILVRIYIPGPMNERHVFSISHEQTSLMLKDMFSLINKKKSESQFTPAYFDFFYENEPGALPLNSKVLDIKDKGLVILPKNTSEISPNEIEQSFSYELVKLANESKEYIMSKIKNNRKDTRILKIDGEKIIKKAPNDDHGYGYGLGKNLGIGKKDREPIYLSTISKIYINPKNLKQFYIHYKDNKLQEKLQLYELKEKKLVNEFVEKVKYIKKINKYKMKI